MKIINSVVSSVLLLSSTAMPIISYANMGQKMPYADDSYKKQELEVVNTNDANSLKNLELADVKVNNVIYDNVGALNTAVLNNNAVALKKLVNNGVSINSVDANGDTAMHVAVRQQNAAMIKLLKKFKPDLTIKNLNNETPIDIAINSGNAKIAALLNVKAVLTKSDAQSGVSAGEEAVAEGAAKSGISATTIAGVVGGLAVVGGGIALASGGGGGGGNTAAPVATPVKTDPIVTPPSTPDQAKADAEAKANNGGSTAAKVIDFSDPQYNIKLVQADVAHNAGKTGAGIRIAIIDNGFDTSNKIIDQSFNKNLARQVVIRGITSNAEIKTELVEGVESKNSNETHGSEVAGIISMERKAGSNDPYGIAYDAEILPIKVKFDSLAQVRARDAMKYASDNGAKIINNSWGSAPYQQGFSVNQDILSGARYAKSKGVVMVFAALNDGAKDVTFEAALPKFDSSLLGYVIAATSYNVETKDLAIADYSSTPGESKKANACGVAANWCLAVPVIGSYTVVDKNLKNEIDNEVKNTNETLEQVYQRIETETGIKITGDYMQFTKVGPTSFAAPMVSGAIALIMKQGVSAKDAADILLETADDLGIKGTDEVFGRGGMNVARALAPIGSLSTPTAQNVNGNKIALGDTKIVASSAFGNAFAKQDLQMAFLDTKNRAYLTDFNNNVFASPSNFSNNFINFSDDSLLDNRVVQDNFTLAFSEFGGYKVDSSNEPSVKDSKLAPLYANIDYKNYGMSLYNDLNPNDFLGFNNELDDKAKAQTALVPYFSGLSNASAIGYNYNLSSKWNFKTLGYMAAEEKDREYSSSGFVSQLNYDNLDKYQIGLQFGLNKETNGLLGSKTQGAFKIKGDTPTYFAAIGAKYQLNDKWSLSGAYYSGITSADTDSNSLVKNLSNIRSDSYNISLLKKNILNKEDEMMFAISQPLRVTSGSANLNLPVGRDMEGNVYFDEHKINLAAPGRELDFEALYSGKIGQDSNIAASLMYRTQPNNIKENDNEGVMMVKYNYKF